MTKCGVDMVDINRIKKSLTNPLFLKRFFTQNEQSLFSSKKNPIPSIAANFAGKEAVSKAMGTGIRGFSLQDIEILRNDLGKPTLKFFNSLEIYNENFEFDISLSHTETTAIAMVVMNKKESV